MTDDDLTRLRDEVAELVHPWLDGAEHCPYRPVSVCHNHRRSGMLADALLPLLARKIAEARCPLTEHAPVNGAADRVRRFLDAREGHFPIDVLAVVTRTGDRLLASDLRTLVEALVPETTPNGPETAPGAPQPPSPVSADHRDAADPSEER